MARKLAMKQFLYKYASSEDTTKLLNGTEYNPFEHDLYLQEFQLHHEQK